MIRKYQQEAYQYSSGVSRLEAKLEEAMQQLSSVNNILGINAENSKDLLSYNVIVCNQEIKSEISELVSNLGNYKSLVSSKAKQIDDRLERERLMALRRQQAKETSTNTNTNVIESYDR